MKRRIGHWALAALLACSLATPPTSAAEKATATKKATVKKTKVSRDGKKPPEPKAQTTEKPASPNPISTSAANPKSPAALSVAPATPPPKKPTAASATATGSTATGMERDTAEAPSQQGSGESESSTAIVTLLANELAATRSYRRDASRESAWKLWGAATRDPNGRAELERHARRLARLRHVLRLAKAEGKATTADRALQLIDLELLRHERAMNQELPQKPAAAGAP